MHGERQYRHREKAKQLELQQVNERNALRNGTVTPPDKNRTEEIREDKTRGTRLDPSARLDDKYREAALAIKAIDDDELQRVFDDFRDYWIAAPGAKGVKLDWLATWRMWVRRQKTTAALTVKKNTYSDN